MKNIVTLLLLFTCNIALAQNLKQQLWAFASDCHNTITQGYKDSFDKVPEKLEDYCNTCIDDSDNGYLYIKGSWPTCGCSCSSEIGAYRNANGNYTLLKYESWSCKNTFGIYSNKNLIDILPKHLSIKTFHPSIQTDTINYFHLEMEIPRLGTDTKVNLKMFPLGQVGVGKKGISYNTKNSKILYPSLYAIKWKVATYLQNDSQLQLIINTKIDDLPKTIKNKILSHIGKNKTFKSQEYLITKLVYIKNIYDTYISLQYTEMTFSWNRILGKFEIKDKTGKPEKISFLEFIKQAQYFSVVC